MRPVFEIKREEPLMRESVVRKYDSLKECEKETGIPARKISKAGVKGFKTEDGKILRCDKP
ncbi:hypothetical protein [Methanolapillus millepedarum]|uniref:Uncharacterized protein n=1 Tax=Methanolapillus millepedarum TaxID=3028296 RepID=A0AA96V4P4_9EURY|nr:hypothetical protein MsAc7_17310 [Methanosarcinaceae archaeon Ac7]